MKKSVQTQASPKNLKKILSLVKKIFFSKALIVIIIIATILILLNPQRITKDITIHDTEQTQEEIENLPETGKDREIRKVASSVPDMEEDTETIPQQEENLIYGLTIDASVNLPKPDSFVRVVLVSDTNNEYLIYEAYPLLESEESFSAVQVCEETCLLSGIKMKEFRIETEREGTIDITGVNKNTQIVEITEEEINESRELVLDQKVAKLKKEIQETDLKWEAGKTSFARLSYAQKKQMYEDKLPNFQGLEFYKGGVFETIVDATSVKEPTSPPEFSGLGNILTRQATFMMDNLLKNAGLVGEVKSVTAAASIYIDSWDWREQHGADDPSSFYFDGNQDSQETGNGWITSVKDQRSCGSCWAFAATGATEALVNLYYNDHIDLNLSEQDALSCSGAGSCGGGWPSVTLDYYTSTGVVDESCFPYTATDQSCNNKCANPAELIKISGRVQFNVKTEDNLKGMILQYGPMSGGIYSWSHALTLVGWNTDGNGDTIWIFKNSWGKSWGVGGYLYLKTPITNIGWTHALINPIVEEKSRSIRCIDSDGDGYYNWGISSAKPASCPIEAPDEKDCDDTNAALVAFDNSYECGGLPSDITFSLQSYNFNKIPVGQSSDPIEVEIGNIGTGDLSISNISLLGSTHFQLDLSSEKVASPCNQINPTVAPNDTCSIELTFTPQSVGHFLTVVLVASNDKNYPTSRVTISGSGSNDPKVVCSYFSGSWIEETEDCYGITDQQCTDYDGELDPCGSYCPPGLFCPLNCSPTCSF